MQTLLRVEKAILASVISCPNYEQNARSTKDGFFQGLELTACTTNLTHHQKLALAFYYGFDTQKDSYQVIEQIIVNFQPFLSWLDNEKYTQDATYCNKVNKLILSIVYQFKTGQNPNANFIAMSMSVTERAYNKTWLKRRKLLVKPVIEQLYQLALEASSVVYKNLR